MDPDSPVPEAVVDIRAALARIEDALASDPSEAEALALRLLAVHPAQPAARLYQGIARRLSGRPAAAIDVLETLCRDWPESESAHLQLGLARREAGLDTEAEQALQQAIAINPEYSDGWLALADLLWARGDRAGADAAFSEYVRHSIKDPRLLEPARALGENRVEQAETMLRARLERHPNDVAAMHLLADAAVRRGRLREAIALLQRALELAPGYQAARHNLAVALIQLNMPGDALRESEVLLEEDPRNPDFRKLKTAALVRLARYREAIEIYRDLVRDAPGDPGLWTSLGHALRTVGRRSDSEAAYRHAIAASPGYGEAYWSLANLKTFRFSDEEIAAMRGRLARGGVRDEDRVHLLFAMGKALEDRGEYEQAFRQYAEGNRTRRRDVPYDNDEFADFVRRSKMLFTKRFFLERAGAGTGEQDPIFIVGLPRSGSTLVEQILSSHSAAEGTFELPDIMGMAQALSEGGAGAGVMRYPECIAEIPATAFSELGKRYIEQTRRYRFKGTPRFIDKMPNNFAHIGLIHLILPNSKIVDVRRHPMACGYSLFRHLFAAGQSFAYSLEDIAGYYRGYVDLMAHFDSVLPGRVHRIVYESLVGDPEREIHRLLEYCGLPFEQSCVDFHLSDRAISTPSSEQVRSPIFREGLDHWRHFEPWLSPLRAALGPLADNYPDISAA